MGIVSFGRSANLQHMGSLIKMCGSILIQRKITDSTLIEINGVNCGIINTVAIGEIHEVHVSVYFVSVS
jgi:hypothetical protein